jgi:hypothetical protein
VQLYQVCTFYHCTLYLELRELRAHRTVVLVLSTQLPVYRNCPCTVPAIQTAQECQGHYLVPKGSAAAHLEVCVMRVHYIVLQYLVLVLRLLGSTTRFGVGIHKYHTLRVYQVKIVFRGV